MQTCFSGPGGTVGPLSGSVFSLFLPPLLLFFEIFLIFLSEITASSFVEAKMLLRWELALVLAPAHMPGML